MRGRLRHLAAYGSTNKYQPVINCKASGTSAERPTQTVYCFCPTATMLTMTPAVKATDSQRWVCRIHLFQFNGTSSSRFQEIFERVTNECQVVGIEFLPNAASRREPTLTD